jgi:hypothetical protein
MSTKSTRSLMIRVWLVSRLAHLEISLRRSMTVGIRLIASAIRRHHHAGR